MVVLEPTGRLRGYRARPIGALRDAGAKPVLEALGSQAPSLWDSVMPRLTAHLASGESPFVLVLDDVDLLEADDALAIIAALIENLPHRSMVALAGRAQPKLPVASLRVGGP